MASFPSFEDFYRAANKGRPPLPWQARLARRAASGDWPSEIGVPTGLGKTSCIDIAVWALASSAGSSPADRTSPTRIWWVVNRRLLVDRAFEHAEALRDLLEDPSSGWPEAPTAAREVLTVVADSLRSIGLADYLHGPLHVTRLRGGANLGTRCPDPSKPSLIFSTVPMFATRLLFRGYGTSVGMRPIDAALAGIDSLIFLDEAHLARPLMKLADTLAASDPGNPSTLLNSSRARPRFVALTATGESAADRFDLDEDDRKNPVVRERIEARKRCSLRGAESRNALPRELADAALAFLNSRPNSTCVVFSNTVAVARATHELLAQQLKDADVMLVTGRAREREAARLRDLLLDPRTGAPAGSATARSKPLCVVATQTLEVGADLDFDFLVTQSAGVRALTQRLGRLNRLGQRGHAAAAICHVDDGRDDPVYGPEPSEVWKRLKARADLDLSPERIGRILGAPGDVPARSGTLLQAHLWEFVKTSSPPPDAAPPEVFFDSLDEEGRDITICWRAHVPDDGVRLRPAASESESIDVPIGELRSALQANGIKAIKRLSADRGELETVLLPQLRAGDHVVLPVEAGLYDEFGWNPRSTSTVLDIALLEKGLLPLDPIAVCHLLAEDCSEGCAEIRQLLATLEPSEADEEPHPDHDRVVAAKLISLLGSNRPHAWIQDAEWRGFLDSLVSDVQRPTEGVPFLSAPIKERSITDADIRIEALEELSFGLASAKLFDHTTNVGALAAKIAQAIGLPSDIAEALKQAGYFHDLGKADPRFQRWLDPNGSSESLVAKSSRALASVEAARVAAGWPRGGRHELLSSRVLEEWIASKGSTDWDADLAAHLIASHHGGGRPLVKTVADPQHPNISIEVLGVPVAIRADLSRCDFEQAGRFRRQCERFGAWGTALLEAILRQADHLVSRATEVN